jgi:YidC/Oxa1 family membrane protein insertase
MGNKTTMIGIALLFLLCMGYYFFLVDYVYKKHPDWNPANQPPETAQNSSVSPSTEPSFTASSGPSMSSATTTSTSALAVATMEASTQPTAIGSDNAKDPTYALGLEIDPREAALASVTINSYKNADATERYVFQQPNEDYHQAALATRQVTIDGEAADLTNAVWRLEPGATAGQVSYGIDLLSADNKPLLHIEKTFTVAERGVEKGRDNTVAGYETAVTYNLRNLSDHALKGVRIDTEGPVMPPRDMERFDDRMIVAGYDKGDNASVDVTRDGLSSFKPETPEKDITTEKGYKFLWAGMSSNYFSAVVLEEKEGLLDTVHERCMNASDPSDQRVVDLDLQTTDIPLAAGATADVPLKVFFGPKERALLEGDYYGVFPRAYNQLLATSSSFCGICAVSWLVDTLVFLLWVFHAIFRDWGLAIITLVVLVRAILHPISKRSQVSMMELQKMGPEMERLKKKYGDDKDALAKAQMEMHKEMGITPFLGCLPMFLQMPIWIALYSALQNDISLRQAPFLWGLTWIHDLSRPDRLFHWDAHPVTIPFIGMKLVSLNILPVGVAIVMFLQQKLVPQAPTITAEQQQQQKMMRYMSLLMSVFFYWMPSGLNLYILTSSTIAIFESKIIREHIEKKKAEEKAGKVIVDAKPTRQGKQNTKKKDVLATPPKKGLLGRFWGDLQEKAEQVRKEAERRDRQKKK